MKIGIVIATLRELLAFLGANFNIKEETVNNHKIYKTTINNHQIYAIQSNCGLIDSASATQLLITRFNVELILNYGVTGAIVKGIKVDDIFIVNKVVNYDFDTSSIDHCRVGEYVDIGDVYMNLTSKYIQIAKTIKPDLKDVICASGNKFVEDRVIKDHIHNEFCASIVDMELAAIVKVCINSKIDVLSIKSISDEIDGNGLDFEKNVLASSEKAFNFLLEFINNLK